MNSRLKIKLRSLIYNSGNVVTDIKQLLETKNSGVIGTAIGYCGVAIKLTQFFMDTSKVDVHDISEDLYELQDFDPTIPKELSRTIGLQAVANEKGKLIGADGTTKVFYYKKYNCFMFKGTSWDGLTYFDNLERVGDFLTSARRNIWVSDFLLLTKKTTSDGYREKSTVDLVPLTNKDTSYIRDLDVNFYVEKIASHNWKSILLRGSTGNGKSTLARAIARSTGTDQKVLVITETAVEDLNPNDIYGAIKLTSPDIVVIEDIKLDNPDYLELLENMRHLTKLIISTYMTEEISGKEVIRGQWYKPGMRPGRIDKIFEIPLPNADERKRILRMYTEKEVSKDILDLMDGMTGAYIKAVAGILDSSPEWEWKKEIQDLVRQMPQKFQKD